MAASSRGIAGNSADGWGLRVVNSQNILIYGAGLYSFFNNYNTCTYFSILRVLRRRYCKYVLTVWRSMLGRGQRRDLPDDDLRHRRLVFERRRL